MMQRALRDASDRGCNKVQLLSHKRHVAGGPIVLEKLGFEAEAEGFRLNLQVAPPL